MAFEYFGRFIETYLPAAIDSIDLTQGIADPEGVEFLEVCQKEYSVRLPKKVGLAIDGECCMQRLYGGVFSDYACGGDWNRMLKFLDVFFNVASRNNIEFTVFFNGAMEPDRMDDWIKEQMSIKNRIDAVQKHVFFKATPPPISFWVAPSGLRSYLRILLRRLGVRVVVTSADHHLEVISHMKKYNYHGLLADHSDYVFFDPPRYFSAAQIKMTFKGSLLTKEIHLKDVPELLNIPQSRMYLVASLLGNHILNEQDLNEFHRSFFPGMERKNYATSNIIRAVVDYVRNLESVDDLTDIATRIFGYPDVRCEKFKESIFFYCQGYQRIEAVVEQPEPEQPELEQPEPKQREKNEVFGKKSEEEDKDKKSEEEDNDKKSNNEGDVASGSSCDLNSKEAVVDQPEPEQPEPEQPEPEQPEPEQPEPKQQEENEVFGIMFEDSSEEEDESEKSSNEGFMRNKEGKLIASVSEILQGVKKGRKQKSKFTCVKKSLTETPSIRTTFPQLPTSSASHDTSSASHDQTITSSANNDQPITPSGSIDQPITPPGSVDQPITSPGSVDQPITSPGSVDQPITSPGSIDQPITSSGSVDQPSISNAPYNQPSTSSGIFDQLSTSSGIFNQPSTLSGNFDQTSTSGNIDQPSNSYANNEEINQPVPIYNVAVTVDPKILEKALERHSRGLMHPFIYMVLNHREVKIPVIMEDEVDVDIPSAIAIFRPLRQMVYGVLFNIYQLQEEHSRSPDPVQVMIKEWVHAKNNWYERPNFVPAWRLGWPVPTISDLWFKGGTEDSQARMKAFLSCMRCDIHVFREQDGIPRRFFVLCCVLRYLISHSGKPFFERSELDAFLAQAVDPRLRNHFHLQNLELAEITNRGVTLAALVMEGVDHAVMANDACGSPLSWDMFSPWMFFEGRMFHSKYLKSRIARSIFELCDFNDIQVSMVEQLRSAILQGLQVRFKPAQLNIRRTQFPGGHGASPLQSAGIVHRSFYRHGPRPILNVPGPVAYRGVSRGQHFNPRPRPVGIPRRRAGEFVNAFARVVPPSSASSSSSGKRSSANVILGMGRGAQNQDDPDDFDNLGFQL